MSEPVSSPVIGLIEREMMEDIIEIEGKDYPVVDEYISQLQRMIDPALSTAKTKAEWRSAMDMRYKITDIFWAKMAELYPQIKGMACGLASADMAIKRHFIIIQGPMATIKEDLDSGKASTLVVKGSDTWKHLQRAKQKGFI